jgi:hypothetical protein
MKAPLKQASRISRHRDARGRLNFTRARRLFISNRSASVASWGSAGHRIAAIPYSNPVGRVPRGVSALLPGRFRGILTGTGGGFSVHGISPTQSLI